MKASLLFFFLGFIAFTYAQDLKLELFASNLDSPVNIKHAGDNKLYVVEQDGFIKIINADGAIENTSFLDINSQVINTGNERGLLDLAFHPDYATNGYFFVNYINNSGNTVISRFSRNTNNPLLADSDSELILLSYHQPYSNHNGGDLAFGSDLSSGNIYKITDTTLSIDEDSRANISIYPNPSQNIVNINFGSATNQNISIAISIYDIQGHLVKSIQRNNHIIQQINTSNLSIGIYMLKIESKNGAQTSHKLAIN